MPYKNPKLKIKKRLAVLAAVFALGASSALGFFVAPGTVFAAPTCTPNPAGPVACIEIIQIPSSVAVNEAFTVTVRLTGSNYPPGLTSNVSVDLYIDQLIDNLLAPTQNVQVAGEAGGNISEIIIFNLTATGELTLGSQEIYAQVTAQSGARTQTSNSTIEITPAQASNQDSLATNASAGGGFGGMGTDPSGLNWDFTGSFIPAGDTTPSQPPGVKITWNFGDGSTGTGYNVSHRYTTPGSYTVTAQATNAAGKVLAQATPITLDTAGTKPANQPNADDAFSTIVASFLSPIFMAIQTFLFMFYWALIMPFIIAAASIQTGIGSCSAGAGTAFLANICGAWEIVRNFVNIIFILLMIVIGISTILRLQSYNYKKLLGKLIIMALLVNFSLVIAQAILKLADILQFTFMDGDSVWQLTKLGYKLIAFHFVTVGGVDSLAAIGQAITLQFSFVGQIQVLAAEILNLSLSFLAFVVMGAIAVFLLIRLVALWILLVLSPLAYALFVIPSLAGMAKTWWTTFFKYAFFTPILFFFMRIAIKISENKTFFGTFTDGCDLLKAADPTATCPASMSLWTTFVYDTLSQIVVMGFLFGALMVANKLSIAGGSAMANWGQKAMMLPLAGAGFLGGAAVGAGLRGYSGAMGRRISKALGEGERLQKAGDKVGAAAMFSKADRYKALGMLNPLVAKQAWEERSKEKDFEAYAATSGHARDFLNRYMPTEWHKDEEGKRHLGQETYYGRIGEKAIINHKKKEWEEANLSEEEKNLAMSKAVHPYDLQALGEMHIEGRHEDGRRITEGQRAQEARMSQIVEELKAQGNDEDAARELAKRQVDKEVSEGKLPGASYDAVGDWLADTKAYKKKGLSAGQIGNIGSAQSELAEKDRKIRALGQEVRLGNTFYSTADPEYLKALAEQEGNTAMLQKVEGMNISGMSVTKWKPLLKADGSAILDNDGKPMQVPAELDFKGQKFNDFESLNKVLEDTSLEKGVSYGSGDNLHYEIAGALKAESAEKRIMRGDTEQWGAAFEPAAWMEQTPDGFGRFTSFGKRMIKSLSAAQVNSFNQSRRMQARAMKIGGFEVDHASGETLLKNPRILDELFNLNRDLAVGLTAKGDFTNEQARKIADALNKQAGSNKYRPSAGKTQRGGFSIEMN